MTQDPNFKVLIAPKKLKDFSATEYHDYVKGMYKKRVKRSSATAKPKSPVSGVRISKTKRGNVGIARSKKLRAFPYITDPEIRALCSHHKLTYSVLWTAFKKKNWIVAADRLKAEEAYAKLRGLPW